MRSLSEGSSSVLWVTSMTYIGSSCGTRLSSKTFTVLDHIEQTTATCTLSSPIPLVGDLPLGLRDKASTTIIILFSLPVLWIMDNFWSTI